MNIRLVPLSYAHGELLSQMHGRCFDEQWSAQSFIDLVEMPASYGYIAQNEEDDMPLGFILCQGDDLEAEIILIATDPTVRRSGVASVLLEKALEVTKRMFLEVAEDNVSAITFYRKHGFCDLARRKGYYKRKAAPSVDAIVMEWMA